MSHPVRRRRMVWRVYLFSLFLLIAVAFSIAAVGAAFQGERGRRQFPQRMVGHIAHDLEPVLDRPADLADALVRVGRSLDLQLSVRSLDGALLASNEAVPTDALDPASLAALREEGPTRLERKPPRVAALLSTGGQPSAYLVADFPEIEVPLSRPIAILGTVLLVLALVSLPFARSLVAPLERLTATAEELGKGRLSARSGIHRNDEVGTLAAAFDEMAKRLEALVHGEKELLANVSHELRTPLARIRVALELAAEGDLEEARRYLGEIGADLGELDRLIEDVLTAARLDLGIGGSPPLRLGEVAARELVDASAGHFQREHPERQLELSLEEPLPSLHADPILIRRVLDNLIDNARKYSDGPIRLISRVSAGWLELSVEDRGIGIDPEDLERLSRPFFRTDRSRAHRAGGIGLGLSLVRSIVEAHGGRLEIESQPGQGSVFRVLLPVTLQTPAPIARARPG